MVHDREDLGNAIALNSSLVHSARLIGPSIAGLLIAATGEAVCFAVNAASYLGVICALAAMRLTPRSNQTRQRNVLHELHEGFRYVFDFTPIRSILFLVATVSLLGMSYSSLLPVFARDIHNGGAHTFGFLMGSAGGGALIGTVYLASRKSVVGLGRIIARAPFLLGGGIAVFAFSTSFPVSLAALMLAGFGAMTLVASSNTILQTIVEEDKRGRAMSFFTMSFMGMTPFGSLLAGSLAETIGSRNTVLFGAISCFAAGALFVRQLPQIRASIRPIYERMGIIRVDADEFGAAADGLSVPTGNSEGIHLSDKERGRD
jgi:MFS family permease